MVSEEDNNSNNDDDLDPGISPASIFANLTTNELQDSSNKENVTNHSTSESQIEDNPDHSVSNSSHELDDESLIDSDNNSATLIDDEENENIANNPEEEVEQYIVSLNNRGAIAIFGKDAKDFLQRILTNDIEKVSEEFTQYSLLLTPNGKFLYDFFICQMGDGFLLDCDLSKVSEIIETLEKYKLQSEIEIINSTRNFYIYAIVGEGVIEAIDPEQRPGKIFDFGDGIIFIDPRMPAMQARVINYYDPDQENNEKPKILSSGFIPADYETYEFLRLWVGVPDTNRDMVSGKSFPFDYGLHQMNAIDTTKGCYVGQEIIARFNNKGTVKNRLYPIKINSESMPLAGTPVKVEHQVIGKFCSGFDQIGIALLSIKSVEKALENKVQFFIDDIEITIDDNNPEDEPLAEVAE